MSTKTFTIADLTTGEYFSGDQYEMADIVRQAFTVPECGCECCQVAELAAVSLENGRQPDDADQVYLGIRVTVE